MKDSFASRFALRTLPAAMLLAMVLAAPMAQAQPSPAAGPARHGATMNAGKLLAIGATEAQQSQIQAILKQARDDMRAQRKASGNLRQQLAQVLASPSVDASAAESVRQKIVAQQDSSSQRMLQARLQVAAVLTPDQRQKLFALDEQGRARWRGRHAGAAGA